MRRLEASIEGTETEKRLFARFRAATAEGVAPHLCHFSAFWRRLTPATGCQDEAVKRAVVALAAAYQLFRHPHEASIDGLGRGDLEVFMIQQYNRSIEQLQSHAGSSASESIRVTLVCCLAFISLETLRGNHSVAVTHLINGLRILQSLSDPAFDCLADGSVFVWRPAGETLHMPDIVQLFAQLEVSVCFFAHGIQPVVSERGYRMRRFDDGMGNAPFADVANARSVLSCFRHDAMARLHEIAAVGAAGDEALGAFWSDPMQQRQQSCMAARSARIGALVADFLSPARFGNPDPTTAELFGLHLDLLYFRCAQFLLSKVTTSTNTRSTTTTTYSSSNDLIPPTFDPLSATTFEPYQPQQHHQQQQSQPPPNDDPDFTLLPSILHLASRLSASPITQISIPFTTTTTTTMTTTRTLTTINELHNHLLGPLYLVATHTPDAGVRSAATRLLAETIIISYCCCCCCQKQRQYHERCCSTTGTEHAQGRKRRVLAVVEETIQKEKAAAAATATGRNGGTWLSSSIMSAEVPARALVGVGCLPLLWDALLGLGDAAEGGGCWVGEGKESTERTRG
ncbi:uncharacterized protein B0T15DRAFT_527607 [Chaetomium strumarium]|uniref:Transcription factor domain-containing protein n=1 Tax=Chaetomium strumarium TaxID=1170767 RepID=A0AAJ0GV04_9PEZI|nr:hypothetical protein B0T15DRAFT_527607 [Chaetomium strumarium]